MFACSPRRPGDKIQQLFKEAVGDVETKGSLNADRSYRRLQAIRRKKLDVSGRHLSQQKGADDHGTLVSTGMRT